MSSKYESMTGQIDLAFPEYDAPPPEPMPLVQTWIAEAIEQGVREPLALALGTANRLGRTSVRIVTVFDVSADGVLFTTHSTSRKGREIAETQWASGLLYWRETAQQLCLSGPAVQLDNTESDRLWFDRAPALHPMSTASRQSELLEDPQLLQVEADRLAEASPPLPRPDRFVGYRLRPHVVEFWSGAETRLHRRLRFEWTPNGWYATRLQP